MIKHGIDQEALIQQFSQATAQQGDARRKAVKEATLKALQARELTLANIKQVLNTVAKAASAGAAGSPLAAIDVEGLLGKAFAGMDGALEQAVQANRTALQKMVDQGASLRETQLRRRSPTSRRWRTPCSTRCARPQPVRRARPALARRCKGHGPRCWIRRKARRRTPAPWPAPLSSSCWTTPSKGCAAAGRWA